MTKLNYKTSFLFLALLFATFFALEGIASAQSKKTVKRDAAVAKKVLKTTKDSLTTTININNGLISQLRTDGKCAGNIIKNSPGWWTGDSRPSQEALEQTEGAENFAFLATQGNALVETLKAGRWAEGSLRSASKRVRKGHVRNLLKSQANFIKELRAVGQKPINVCDTLKAWKDGDYKGIYSLVNASWGENELQTRNKKVRFALNNWSKSSSKLLDILGGNAFNSLGVFVYQRAFNIYDNSFYRETDSETPSPLRNVPLFKGTV